MNIRALISLAIGLAAVSPGRADYFDETGYRELAGKLGAGLPDGTGVEVTQVEYGNPEYLPQGGTGSIAGTGQFADKVINAKSGASTSSGHASLVAAHFYSRNSDPTVSQTSFTPGISVIDVYRVDPGLNSWAYRGWLEPGVVVEPLIERRSIQNHSWIDPGSFGDAADNNVVLRRFDFAIRRDGFLAVTGVNNGVSGVPAMMASAYNNLSVGLSTGLHSTGGVPGWLDGPHRQKPEITAPMTFTSFATSLVSSAAALLRQTANTQGPNATRPETLKAILLAGATKEEFPQWARTATTPLDPVYGAGELHVGNAWHILAGQEQAANLVAPRPAMAWSRVTLKPAGTADYLLHIPNGLIGEALSVTAVWNRVIADTLTGNAFRMAVVPLADYQLALHRIPASGSPVLVDQSISGIENLEHLYQQKLPSGTYRLRLSLASEGDVPASLAWRLSTLPHQPDIVLEHAGSTIKLSFTGLVKGQAYLIQSTTELVNWSAEQAFTATGPQYSWTATTPVKRGFYRLAATD